MLVSPRLILAAALLLCACPLHAVGTDYLQLVSPRPGETLRQETELGPPWLLARMLRKSRVPGSSRAFGWDTMLPTSSSGTRLSRAAFGHTGFTGTSLWIDPLRDLYVVLLTNRVHPTRPADTNDLLRRLRPAVHDAVVAALDQ